MIRPDLIEVPVISEWYAGTADVVAGSTVIDFKTRGSSHRIDPKDWAQLGALAHALNHGRYVDRDGELREYPTEITCGVIVSICPDATYREYRLDADDLAHGWEMFQRSADVAADIRHARAARFDSKPVTFDHNATLVGRIAELCEADKMALAAAWRDAGLGRASAGELSIEDYALADRLINDVDPFAIPDQPRSPLASTEVAANLADRFRALPADLRAGAEAATVGIRMSLMSEAEAATISTALDAFEHQAGSRMYEIALVGRTRAMAAIVDHIGAPETWTDADLDTAHNIAAAVERGRMDADTLAPIGWDEWRPKMADIRPIAAELGVRATTLAEVAASVALVAALAAA